MLLHYQEHLKELRNRVMYSLLFFLLFFLLGYCIRDIIILILISPITNNLSKLIFSKIITFNIFETFFISIKSAVLFSLFCSLPIFYYHIFSFLQPAIKKKWHKTFLFLTFTSATLLYLSIFIVYFIIVPNILFFMNYFQLLNMQITNFISLESYLRLLTTCTFAFSIIFQLPICCVCIVLCKIIKITTLYQIRKHMIISSFIVAGIIAPPDILSHIILACFMIVLYEITLFAIKQFIMK